MKKATWVLVRDTVNDEHSVYGILAAEVVEIGRVVIQTLELPWRDNKSRISCIPKGVYRLEETKYYRGGGYPALAIMNVPGRTDIKIHRANWPSDLWGCTAPGLMRSKMKRKEPGATPEFAVSRSAEGLDLLVALHKAAVAVGYVIDLEVEGVVG